MDYIRNSPLTEEETKRVDAILRKGVAADFAKGKGRTVVLQCYQRGLITREAANDLIRMCENDQEFVIEKIVQISSDQFQRGKNLFETDDDFNIMLDELEDRPVR